MRRIYLLKTPESTAPHEKAGNSNLLIRSALHQLYRYRRIYRAQCFPSPFQRSSGHILDEIANWDTVEMDVNLTPSNSIHTNATWKEYSKKFEEQSIFLRPEINPFSSTFGGPELSGRCSKQGVEVGPAQASPDK